MASADFTKRMQDMIMGGFTSMTFSLGHQLGIFQFMAEHDHTPMTSVEIAEATGMKERYLREWLSAMATSQIVDVDESGTRFTFPKVRLTNMAGLGAIGSLLAVCGHNLMKVKDCFALEGPSGFASTESAIYYDALDHIHDIPGSSQNKVQEYLAKAPGVQEQLESGISVLEVGCGRGPFSCAFAEVFPKSTFHGFDLTETDTANRRAKEKNLTNVTFEKRSLFDLPPEWDKAWDLVLVHDVLHDLPYPDKGIAAMYRVIKPGGLALVADVEAHSTLRDNLSSPGISYLYTMSLFSCMPDSLNTPGGEGLGACAGQEVMEEKLTQAGFKVTVEKMPKGYDQLVYVCRKEEN